MSQTQIQYQHLVIQWHALKAALKAYGDEDEGMATLEVVIIAGGLVAIALALMIVITRVYTSHAASISG